MQARREKSRNYIDGSNRCSETVRQYQVEQRVEDTVSVRLAVLVSEEGSTFPASVACARSAKFNISQSTCGVSNIQTVSKVSREAAVYFA